MKKLIALIGAVTLMTAITTSAVRAESFPSQVWDWATSLDTNSTTFAADRGSLSAGSTYQKGVLWSADLTAEARVYKFLSAEAVGRWTDSDMLQAQAGIGGNITLHDLRLTAFLDGGYDWQREAYYAALGLRVKKALGQRTYAGAGLESQFFGKRPSTPMVSLFTGLTF